jgi:hypothetical protein
MRAWRRQGVMSQGEITAQVEAEVARVKRVATTARRLSRPAAVVVSCLLLDIVADVLSIARTGAISVSCA